MFDPRERSLAMSFFAFLFIACLLLCGLASTAPSITLSKKSGPPTSQILVSGLGFEPNVGVDIFFDTTDEALGVTKPFSSYTASRAMAGCCPRLVVPIEGSYRNRGLANA
jgi:hypothetical protein